MRRKYLIHSRFFFDKKKIHCYNIPWGLDMIEYISYHRGKCYVFTQYRKFWVNSLHDENVQEGDDYMNYIGNMVTYLFPLNVNIYRPFSFQCRKFWLNLLMKKMFKKESQINVRTASDVTYYHSTFVFTPGGVFTT